MSCLGFELCTDCCQHETQKHKHKHIFCKSCKKVHLWKCFIAMLESAESSKNPEKFHWWFWPQSVHQCAKGPCFRPFTKSFCFNLIWLNLVKVLGRTFQKIYNIRKLVKEHPTRIKKVWVSVGNAKFQGFPSFFSFFGEKVGVWKSAGSFGSEQNFKWFSQRQSTTR